jgi:hypothetical protein
MLRKYLGVLAILAALFIGATGTVTPAMRKQMVRCLAPHLVSSQIQICGALCGPVMLDRHR